MQKEEYFDEEEEEVVDEKFFNEQGEEYWEEYSKVPNSEILKRIVMASQRDIVPTYFGQRILHQEKILQNLSPGKLRDTVEYIS